MTKQILDVGESCLYHTCLLNRVSSISLQLMNITNQIYYF